MLEVQSLARGSKNIWRGRVLPSPEGMEKEGSKVTVLECMHKHCELLIHTSGSSIN
jgi:hypothetical protein